MRFEEFRKRCLKNRPSNILREISIKISYPLYKRKIHPNSIEFLSLLSSVIFLFFLTENVIYWIIPCIYFAFIFPILDMIDGNLARALNIVSKKGSLIDSIIDCIERALFFIFLFYGCYKVLNDVTFLIMGMVFFMTLYIYNRINAEGYKITSSTFNKNKKINEYDEISVRKMNIFKRIIIFIFVDPTGIGLIILSSIIFTIILQTYYILKITLGAFVIFYAIVPIVRILEWLRYYNEEQ